MIKTESNLRTFSMCVQNARHNILFMKEPAVTDVWNGQFIRICVYRSLCGSMHTYTQWAYQKFNIVFICAFLEMQCIPTDKSTFPMASAYTRHPLHQDSHLIHPKGCKENDRTTQVHKIMWILQQCVEHRKKPRRSYYNSIFPILQMQFTKQETSRRDCLYLESQRQLFLMGGYQLSLSFFLKNTYYL